MKWRKSSYCGNGAACVEVATEHGNILVRDSKNTDGPHLTFDLQFWLEFIQAIKTGEFNVDRMD